jgi:hypothetical protein
MEAVFLIHEDMISREGLTLFPDFLVKACPDHVQKPVKLRAPFHFLDEIRYLLDREGNGTGEMLLEFLVKLTMLQVDLAFFIAASAMEAEVEGEQFRELKFLCLQSPLHGEELSSRSEGFVSGGPINRTLTDAISALGTGHNVMGYFFKPFRNNRDTLPKRLLRND